MRVLWFSVTHAMYDDAPGMKHNGGGWISSLQNIVQNIPEIELAIAFEHADPVFKKQIGKTTYYPIRALKMTLSRFKKAISLDYEAKVLLPECLKVIEDFRPDVIHVFGSEWCWGLIQEHTKIPVVIHMQGSIPPYNNAKVSGLGVFETIYGLRFNPRKCFRSWQDKRQGRTRARREEKILRMTRHFMGRTDWDKGIAALYAPKSNYYYCAEAMRSQFFENFPRWEWTKCDTLKIVTTGNAAQVKGIDVILKCASLMSKLTSLKFQWNIIGASDITFYERFTGIRSNDVNVKSLGVLTAERVASLLLDSHIYVQPSYIENSPNALCEAQLLGMPVIASYTGGVPSLINSNVDGLLFPVNDPFSLANLIRQLSFDPCRAIQMGVEARCAALQRHSPDCISMDLLNVYTEISGVTV